MGDYGGLGDFEFGLPTEVDHCDDGADHAERVDGERVQVASVGDVDCLDHEKVLL